MQQWGIQHVALSPDIGTGRNQPFTWKHPGPRGLWGSCSTGRGSNSKNHWGWAGRAPRPGTRVQCPSVSTWGSWGDSWKVQTWHYRKVTRSTVCLTQRCYVPADSLRRWGLPAQASAPCGSIPQPGRLARTAGREPGQHYMVLQLFFPPHFPTCTRRKTHPCRVIHSQTAWQNVPTSTRYPIQKGPREEALPTKSHC